VRFPFKIGLTVNVIFFKYVAFIEMVYGKYWYMDSLFDIFLSSEVLALLAQLYF